MINFVSDYHASSPNIQFYDPNNGQVSDRYLCWDEESRLSATRDNNYVTANIYDASGNRSWTLRRGSAQALAGEMNWMWQNGSGWQGYGDLNLRTWYQSELMTITDVGFTKHYFIAGQRIASKLGESLNNADVQPLRENHVEPLTENYKVLNQGTAERMRRDFECLSLDYNNFTPGEPAIQVLHELAAVSDANETNIIFYHSDHLGSSSFLTDGGGVATQHLQYMPFGEDLVHQQNTAAYYTPYTFSGKERDMEMRSIREDLKKISTTEQTGLSYFGARYYDAGLSVWLSVDPMADKYPSLSAYNYCAWNPVMLVDPDGREIEEGSKEGWNKHKNNVATRVEQLKVASSILNRFGMSSEGVDKRIDVLGATLSGMDAMENSSQMYALGDASNGTAYTYMRDDGVIEMQTDGSTSNFVHEVTHGIQFENNEIGFEKGKKQAGSANSINNELQAYTAELAYEGRLAVGGVTQFNQINSNFLSNISSGGTPVYKNLALIPINPNMNAAEMIKAYPHLSGLGVNQTLRSAFPQYNWKK